MFRTKYIPKEVKYTDSGSPIKTVYEAKYNKDKNLEVVPKGTENLYQYINSFALQSDINVIMKKFMAGDKEVLLQRAGMYADISNVPKDFQGMVDCQLAANNLYNTLPAEIKEKFDNNVNKFISMLGTKEYEEIMNTSQDQIYRDEVKEKTKIEQRLKDVVKHKPEPIENPGVDVPDEGDIK